MEKHTVEGLIEERKKFEDAKEFLIGEIKSGNFRNTEYDNERLGWIQRSKSDLNRMIIEHKAGLCTIQVGF